MLNVCFHLEYLIHRMMGLFTCKEIQKKSDEAASLGNAKNYVTVNSLNALSLKSHPAFVQFALRASRSHSK